MAGQRGRPRTGKRKGRANELTPTIVQSEKTLHDILQMRLAKMTLQQIGDAMGVTKQSISARIKKDIEKTREQNDALRELLRWRQHDEVEADRAELDELIDTLKGRLIVQQLDDEGSPAFEAIDSKVATALISAINSKDKLREREDKLWGISERAGVEVNVTNNVQAAFAVPLAETTVGDWEAQAATLDAADADVVEALLDDNSAQD